MKPRPMLLAWLSFAVLCPVLNISGHFIYPPELMLYAAATLRILRGARRARGENTEALKGARKLLRSFTRAQFVYALLFFLAAALSAWLADQEVGNYDLFVLRNILQVGLALLVFGDKADALEHRGRLDRAIFAALIVLCIPALIVYLQRLDLFSMRSLVSQLYKPQFFFLGERQFASYRYTSVFKDFFTAAVYFTLLSGFLFYFCLRTKLRAGYRYALVFMLAFVYTAQLFVARTSLLVIPFLLAAIALAGVKMNAQMLLRRLLPTAVLAAIVAAIALPQLLGGGLVNSKWAMEGLAVFSSDDRDAPSSFTVMQNWYEQMYEQAFEGRFSLLTPHHAYDLTERNDPGRYTDSFYGQELYRYGIYGAVAYFAYLALLAIPALKTNRTALILVIALAVMNYKGGNTFFMPKTLYLYALILALTPYIENRRPNAWRRSASSPLSSPILPSAEVSSRAAS